MIMIFALFPKMMVWELALGSSHCLLNMNIEGNIQSHAVTSLMMSSCSKWFHFAQFAIYFSYPKWNWSYHVQDMDFENSRKQFLFSTSDNLSNRNLSVLERCSMSHILWQYFSSRWRCTMKTDQVMAILRFHLLIDLGTSSMTSWVCNT